MLVIGTLCAIYLAKLLARRKGLNPELFVNAGLLALLAGVVGARLAYVIEFYHQFTPPSQSLMSFLWEAMNIRSGGLTYYGGFLLAFPVLIIYGRIVKVPIPVGMDIIAPCVMIGLAFGRIGCLLNGCCYGEMCNSPLSVTFPYYSDAYREQVDAGLIRVPRQLYIPETRQLIPPDFAKRDPDLATLVAQQRSLPVLPTEIYSSLTAFLIAGLLLTYMPFNRHPGRVMALLLMIEPVTRFLLEGIRVNPPLYPPWFGTLAMSQVLAVPQFLVGLGLWWFFGWLNSRQQPVRAKPTGAN
jgi:phosphatidylglycerol:prolipoprotein diacylglycerol transferase